MLSLVLLLVYQHRETGMTKNSLPMIFVQNSEKLNKFVIILWYNTIYLAPPPLLYMVTGSTMKK